MKQINIKAAFIEFGHFIALGVSILIVLTTLIFGGGVKGGEKALKDAQKNKKKLQENLDSSRPETATVGDFLGMLQKNWEQTIPLEKAPSHDSFYEPPKIKFIIPVPPAQQWINGSENITVDVQMEKLTVKWDEPTDLSDKDPAVIDGYFLIRRWEDRGKKGEKIIEFIGKASTLYDDIHVESKIAYYYKVCAYTENKEAKGGEKFDYRGQELVLSEETKEKLSGQSKTAGDWIKDLVVSKKTKEVKGAILPSFKLELNGVAGNDMAMLRLAKWEKGSWRSTICRIKEGEKIKVVGFVSGIGKIDWDPGWTLVRVNPREEITRIKTISKLVMDASGKKPVRKDDGQFLYKVVEVPYKDYTYAIEYVDEKGIKQKLLRREDEIAKDKKNP